MTKHISLNDWVLRQTQLPAKSVEATINLLASGATIPFIARYRKEVSGGLDELEIEAIQKSRLQYEDLLKRKDTILKSIEEQGKLTEQLREQILTCLDATSLEDIYLPYKPRKETKADKARKLGLEPLAKIIMKQDAFELSGVVRRYINLAVKTEEEALEGARHIIAEWMNERQALRDRFRNMISRKGVLSAKLVRGKEEDGEKYKDYFQWEEPLSRVAAHRFLAMARGEKEGILRLKINLEEEEVLQQMYRFFIKGSNSACTEQIQLAAKDAWKRLLHPALENEFKKLHKEAADKESITVFAENLRQLLLAPPLGEKRVLAIDPGFRTGCKVVCLDENGKLLHNETIYPHPPQNESTAAAKKITTLVSAYKIEAIAIGNGTAGRETDHFIRKLSFAHQVYSFMVNESGASIYSASKTAREEFPDYDVTVRGAVSIGRRLMDPLAELVKIDPKSIGVGQYQHDVDQKMLQEALDRVVESSVNKIGVNVNTASKHLLQYISGLGPKLAETIVSQRESEGAYRNREALKKVKGMGAVAFQQSAGFLRILGGDDPLDETGIHPERYQLVKKIASDEQLELTALIKNKERVEAINFKQYEGDEVGALTLADIKEELQKPGRDPREKRKAFEFDATVRKMEDLRVGMILPGLVSNITNFGAFVDIGVKQDGLVHVSQLANRFVKDPNEVVKLGDAVKVKVMEVDAARKRIQLSMKEV
jgi:uncharacterized protein